MNALRPVQLAIELAERQRDQVAQVLAGAVQNQAAAQSQMDMLEAYARETENKGFARAQVLTSRALMQHQDQFMGKLDQAMVFQRGVIQNHAGRVVQLRQSLVEAEQKLARFKHIFEARQAEMAKAQGRREQKQADEMAARQVSQQRRRLDAEEPSWASN